MDKKRNLGKFTKAARMLRVVAHPARIEIINCLIKEKRLSVGELREKLGITQSMTSQHLAQLRNIGVLGCQKEANICYYSILNRNVLKLLDCVERCVTDHNA